MIRISSLRPIAIAVAASLLLAACATDGSSPSADGQPLSPEEQRLRQQADTFNQTMAEGALTGCLAGMLVGILASNNKARGAIAGCVVGGGIGAGAGAYVAQKQSDYADTEQRYDSMIDDVRKDNQRLAEVIQTSRVTIAADRHRIDEIDADLAAKKISLNDAKVRMSRVDSNTAYLQKTIASLKERRDNYIAAAQQSKTGSTAAQHAQMDQQITTLQSQIAQLDEQLNALVTRRKVSNVG